MAGSISWKRLTAALACVAVGLLADVADALVIATLVVVVLVVLILAEHVAAYRRRQRGEPSPLERLEPSAEVTTTLGA
jgi:hypothetical protein